MIACMRCRQKFQAVGLRRESDVVYEGEIFKIIFPQPICDDCMLEFAAFWIAGCGTRKNKTYLKKRKIFGPKEIEEYLLISQDHGPEKS